MNSNNVEMIKVNSSNVDAIGYDEDNQVLHVRFLNNTEYIYKDIPIGEFEGLKNAPSIGSYLHRNIKNSYLYERIG